MEAVSLTRQAVSSVPRYPAKAFFPQGQATGLQMAENAETLRYLSGFLHDDKKKKTCAKKFSTFDWSKRTKLQTAPDLHDLVHDHTRQRLAHSVSYVRGNSAWWSGIATTRRCPCTATSLTTSASACVRRRASRRRVPNGSIAWYRAYYIVCHVSD